MSIVKFSHVKILGISSVVPRREISIFDEAKYYDNNLKKIQRLKKIVGFNKRRVVESGTTASDLCISASEYLFDEMSVDKKSIDALIYVVQRPDHASPATAYYLHNKLNLDHHCIAFDVRQGCPGWVYGLYVASSLIESGAAKRVLLLAGDTPSVDISLSDRNVAPIFGDGGSATLLEYSSSIFSSYYNISVFSEGYESIIKPASGYRLPFYFDDRDKELIEYVSKNSGGKNRLVDLYMDGASVFEFTMKEVPPNIMDLMSYSNVTPLDLDYLMLHQANKQIVQNIAVATGFSFEQTPWSSFEAYGNQSVTSIPISISHNLSQILPNSNFRLLCSGFGNGLAVASCLLDFINVWCSEVRTYNNENRVERSEYIKYWVKKIKEK